jgi:membrane protease YdiL (CAAX protease family)
MKPAVRQALLVASAALALFAACAALTHTAPLSTMGRQVMLKALLIAASFGAMKLWPAHGADWGLRRPAATRWLPIVGPAAGMGAAASTLILASGGKGLQAALGPMALWQAVLVIWIWSSLSEEIFTRGWLQGTLHPWRDTMLAGLPLPATVSGLVFGAMHFSLFARGVDAISASVIVLAATALGLWAGVLRERFGSILPPLAAHIGFNVGGALGGAAFVIAYRLSTGHLPTQLGTP